jgi:putative peptidoglycan lipid II flippase
MTEPSGQEGPTPAQEDSVETDLDDASVMRSSGIMAAGTLVSRILGLLRTTALAWAIGTTVSSNVFTTANTLPNTFMMLIGGGVLNAVLVPQIVQASHRGAAGKDFVDRLITLSLTVLAVTTLVLTTLAAPLFLLYWSQGADPQAVRLGTLFAVWFLPQMFFYGLYTVLGQVLNARGSFGPYMWAPVVNNLVAILGIVAFVLISGSGDKSVGWWNTGPLVLLAGTTTLGVVAQALILIPPLYRSGFRWRPRWGFRGVGLRSAGQVAGWTFAAVAVQQLAFIVTSKVVNSAGQAAAETGARLQPGRFVLDNATLLFMLPHSLVTVSLVTAFFTRMSHAAAEDRIDDVRDDMSLGLRSTGLATVFATAVFLVLGQQASTLVFLGNDRASGQALFLVTAAMMVGLVPFSAQYLLQRVFYAFEDARTPFRIQVVVSVVWTAGNLLSLLLLPAPWVTIGVGLAMSVSSVVGAVLSLILLRRRIGSTGGSIIVASHLKFVLAAIGAASAAWLTTLVVELFGLPPRVDAVVALAVAGPVMVGLYLGLLRGLGAREADAVLSPLSSRLGRITSPRIPGRHRR